MDSRLLRAIGTPKIQQQASELVERALRALEDLKQLDESLYERFVATRNSPDDAEASANRLRKLWQATFRGLHGLLAYCGTVVGDQKADDADSSGSFDFGDFGESAPAVTANNELELGSLDIGNLLEGLGDNSEDDTAKWNRVVVKVGSIEYGLRAQLGDARILSLVSGKSVDQSFKDVCSAVARESFGINSYGLIGLLAMTVETAFVATLALTKPWVDPVMKGDYLAFGHSVNRMRQSRFFLPAMMVAMVLIGLFSYQVGVQNAKAHDSEHPLPDTIISAQTLEEEYGVQMYLVAVTAAGGMGDVRYRIMDPDKAAKLVDPEDGGIMPMVYVQNGDIMLMPDMHMRSQKLIADRMYFTLIPNTQNAVHRGTIVTVSFGAVALEPMIAK